MPIAASELTQMMKMLSEEDYRAVTKYIEFLISSRQKNAKTTIRQIQKIFTDDKGWASEEEMLSDMADFRRSRLE
ncbi:MULTISPECIES: hypothetical protein [unclassified Treponema]|uniref:hypothetical protein n=1 Tax=unclassified Treponema TaxID=2638727 RepID=UPI0020A3D576|nr:MULTISPECIES: hypothetical protein [unclassified Treponema]UTC66809.1 hypothetical protein E4O06_12820 [Treponema sp. OMZ 789]UTC69541.1 hypothetical protein E4O01_12955 [Treponema sp. OMZ 790]UTC72254.1 hypothetical protein E4O02_13050 [Treponema sp. OMZ 791]